MFEGGAYVCASVSPSPTREQCNYHVPRQCVHDSVPTNKKARHMHDPCHGKEQDHILSFSTHVHGVLLWTPYNGDCYCTLYVLLLWLWLDARL